MKDRMNGISMMEFTRAMKDKTKDTMNTMSMIEFLVFVGYQYGLLVEGVIDHRIHDASFASADDIKFNPGKYSGGCFSITYNEEGGHRLDYLSPDAWGKAWPTSNLCPKCREGGACLLEHMHY